MGQAKRRRMIFLDNHPYCCYCGGNEIATTIDHMPPAIFFHGKHRPKGFEFPACSQCNNGTGKDEQVAAMLSRLDPAADTEQYRPETVKIMGAVRRNHPDLFEEMLPSSSDQRSFSKNHPSFDFGNDAPIMKVNGPLVTQSMTTFGRKLTCAVHYYLTAKIIPKNGSIFVRWYSNVEAHEGEIPESFLELLGGPVTLKQGQFSIEDQFVFRTARSSDEKLSAYFAKFRSAYGIAGIVHCGPVDEEWDFNVGNFFHPFSWDEN